MQPSQRIRSINAAGKDGWETFRRARAMAQAGEPVIELTIGEPDRRTDPRILAAMDRAARGGATGYPPIPGLPALRAAIARRVTAQTGVATGPENIIVTTGGQGALFQAHHAVCDEGDRALYCDPHYATYPGTIRSVGAVPVPVPCPAERGFLPTAQTILDRAAGARSLLINSPNNPTGVIYGPDTLEKIARACREADLWLISDEVYETQTRGTPHLSPRTLPGMAERTLVIGSLSKSHFMTGSRIGWLVAPAGVVEALVALATTMTYGVPGFVQEAALFALGLGAEFEAELAAPFHRRRALALERIARQNVVRAVPAQGAMYLLLDIRATGLGGEAFAEALLDARKVAVMPGESFGVEAAGHVRIALTVADDRLVTALDGLLDFAAEQAKEAA